MLITRAAAATTLSLGLLLAMGACSSGSSDTDTRPSSTTDTTTSSDDETPDDETTDATGSADDSDDNDVSDGATTTDVKSSCEEFNTIMADLRLVDPAESDGYDDIADRAMAAQVTAPDETRFLFAPLYLIALDAGSGNDTDESMDILKDAVFAAAGDCTAQDVTLTM